MKIARDAHQNCKIICRRTRHSLELQLMVEAIDRSIAELELKKRANLLPPKRIPEHAHVWRLSQNRRPTRTELGDVIAGLRQLAEL